MVIHFCKIEYLIYLALLRFDDVMSFHVMSRIKSLSSGVLKQVADGINVDYLDDAFELYSAINQLTVEDEISSEERKKIYEVSKLTISEDGGTYVRDLSVSRNVAPKKLRVGLVNMAIPHEVVSLKYIRKPFVTEQRRKELRKILNLAEEENSDLLVFPEISIPVSSFFWLVDYARNKKRAMVFGLEHWIVDNYALNVVVTLLPLKIDGYKSLVINIRLKNHYSPEENDILTGYGYKIPINEIPYYDLLTWNGTAMTVFNCYELCNIEHRSFFRSKVDILFASEFNKDVNYFSSIVESTTRDLHCYVVQSNDSSFGDSRISQPTSTIEKDIVKIKGGVNPSVIIGELDVDRLRYFQIKNYNGQKRDGNFKPTPPDFDRIQVLNRMKANI